MFNEDQQLEEEMEESAITAASASGNPRGATSSTHVDNEGAMASTLAPPASDPVGSRLASSTSSDSIKSPSTQHPEQRSAVKVVLNDASRSGRHDAEYSRSGGGGDKVHDEPLAASTDYPSQGFVPSPGFHQRRGDEMEVATGNASSVSGVNTTTAAVKSPSSLS